MPKIVRTKVKIPKEKPDCCADCPLVGIIPDYRRVKGSKKTCICLVTKMRMSKRSISIKASERDSHHPLHRPCDGKWESTYITAPRLTLLIDSKAYYECRIPYVQRQQYEIDFGDY